MFAIFVMVLRYLFLLLLFLSIFKLIKWMIGDLQEVAPQNLKENRIVDYHVKPSPHETGDGAELVVVKSLLSELKPGDTFAAGQEVLLGRDSLCSINIAAAFASAMHARIYLKDGQYWLEDLDSTNGTFLNEIPIDKSIVLANGDKIRIGGVIFQFVRWGHEVDASN
ncbi:MAG: FHA domain-containing protein [Desulfotomaculaceae bacterium]|nr:FHA domain-containing protein [Desulfotomaculaceae bacterium]